MKSLETIDGRINGRFVIAIAADETMSEDGSAWLKVEYLAGTELRETYATPDDVSQFLALS
jgi:hypothetical protein